MANLRALGRKPALLSCFFAVSLSATLLLPVAAGAGTGSHPTAEARPVVDAQVGPAHLRAAVRRAPERRPGAATQRAARRPAQPGPTQPGLPSGLDLLLGRRAGSGQSVPRASISCVAPGGLWSSGATWSGGVAPTAADTVSIGSGCTVTIDTAAVALDLTVFSGGVLQFEDTTARTLTAGGNVTIAGGGILQSASTGTQTAHVLSVGGHLFNAGTLDFSTNADTAGAGIVFTGAANATFGNSGTLDLRSTNGVILNKGTSSASTLDFQPGGTITVQGANTAGFLTIGNGTFKITGSDTFSNPLFSVPAYTIPVTGGLWLNDANATIVGQNGSPTNNGSLRLSAGTLNVGTIGTNVMGAGVGAVVHRRGRHVEPQRAPDEREHLRHVDPVGRHGQRLQLGRLHDLAVVRLHRRHGRLHEDLGRHDQPRSEQHERDAPTTTRPGRWSSRGGTLNVGTAATATNFIFRVQGQTPQRGRSTTRRTTRR